MKEYLQGAQGAGLLGCGKGMLELIEEWPHPLFGVPARLVRSSNATIAVAAAKALESVRTAGARWPCVGP